MASRNDLPTSAVLIAGPTASGKSALALKLAAEFDGAVINTDSMQVYSGLAVLTAQPSAAEQAEVAHHLYGVLPPWERCSAGRYVELVKPVLEAVRAEGKLPIFVGGTGLYFRALLEGLSPVPAIPADVRQQVEADLEERGADALFAELEEADPAWSARIERNDRQRLIRGLEVVRATGRPLSDWQQEPGEPVLAEPVVKIILDPPRDWLYQRLDDRFDQMMEDGALDEVRDLLGHALPAQLPAMKALGVPQLLAFLQGEMTREEAVEKAKTLTRRYAKRQLTWFRNQNVSWERVDSQYLERFCSMIFAKICRAP